MTEHLNLHERATYTKSHQTIPKIKFYYLKRLPIVQIAGNQSFIAFYINIMTVIQLTDTHRYLETSCINILYPKYIF